MRIVFATHAYAPAIGGAERYAQGLAEAFVHTGHEVYVLTPNRVSAESFYEYGHEPAGPREDNISGVHVHRIPLDPPRRWSRRGAQAYRAIPDAKTRIMWKRYARTLAERIDHISPDATIALPHSFPNVLAALDAPSRGIAVYAPLLHEEDPAWRVAPIAELVSKSDVVLALTTWERDRLVTTYRSDPDRTYIAPPVVDAPQPENVKSYELDTPYVLAVGRRTRSKNLLMSARAIHNMNFRESRVRLIIAGPGSDPDLDRELQAFDRFVDLVGVVTEEEKWSLIKGSVASVSMSASESFGIGIAEAWAMRRPAIARRVGPIESIVDDGVDGFLVDDEEDLTDKLATLLADPAGADRMGAAGNRKIREPRDSSASTVVSAISAVLDCSYNRPGNGGTSFDGS